MTAAPATAEEIRDVNTRYHDGAAADYDAKWGIDFGDDRPQAGAAASCARCSAARCRRFERALEIGAGHRLLHAEPAAGRRHRRGDVHRHLAGMLDALRGQRRAARPRGDDARSPTPRRCRSPTRPSTSSSATRSCTTCPNLDQAFAEFHRVLAPGRRRGPVRRRAVARRRPHRRLPKRAAAASRRAWRRVLGARRRREGTPRRRRGEPRARGLGRRPRLHARASCARFAAGAGFTDVRVRGEELLANWFGWANRALESTAEPENVPWAVEDVRLPRLPRACRTSTARCSAAAAAGDLLQPDARPRGRPAA